MSDWYARMIDEEFDVAEAEMLEQVNLATGAPLTRLVTPPVTSTGADLSDPDKAGKPSKQAGSEPV